MKRVKLAEEKPLVKIQEEWIKSRMDKRVKHPKCIVAHPSLKGKYWEHYLYTCSEFFKLFQLDPKYHEGIVPHHPCRPFADIDMKPGPDAEGKAMAIVAELQKRITKHGGNPACDIWECIRQDKYSIHVVFYAEWVASPAVMPILTKGLDVDQHPYHSPSRDTCTFLRLPYADKIEEVYGTRMVVQGKRLLPRDGPKQFNLEWFLRGCVSVGFNQPGKLLDIPEPVPQSVRESLPGSRKAIELVLSEVAQITGEFTVTKLYTPSDSEFTATVKPGLFCYNRYRTGDGGYHKSNGSVVGMFQDYRGRFRVYIRCLDKECDGCTRLLPQDYKGNYLSGLE